MSDIKLGGTASTLLGKNRMKIKFHRLERQNPEVKSVKYKILCTEDSQMLKYSVGV